MHREWHKLFVIGRAVIWNNLILPWPLRLVNVGIEWLQHNSVKHAKDYKEFLRVF